MNSVFLRYYFSYILKARHRQKLLILAVTGLVVSSFALLTLQSTMGGLQSKLVERHKTVFGHGEIDIRELDYENQNALYEDFKQKKINAALEYELELLLKHQGHLAPIILHGVKFDVSYIPDFFTDKDLNDLFIGRDLSYKIGLRLDQDVSLISPSHSDVLFGDIPRMVTATVSGRFASEVPEADMFHVFTRLSLVQNLVKNQVANKIRFYSDVKTSVLKGMLKKYNLNIDHVTWWESKNKNLVYALRLETSVMVFLFVSMTLLVSLTITSGLLIFFDKIKIDLASFWILGGSEDVLNKASQLFLVLMSFFASGLGIILSLIFLTILKNYGIEILPDVFIDRKIPIEITFMGLFISFIVPFSISLFFSFVSLQQFKKESSYLTLIRSVS